MKISITFRIDLYEKSDGNGNSRELHPEVLRYDARIWSIAQMTLALIATNYRPVLQHKPFVQRFCSTLGVIVGFYFTPNQSQEIDYRKLITDLMDILAYRLNLIETETPISPTLHDQLTKLLNNHGGNTISASEADEVKTIEKKIFNSVKNRGSSKVRYLVAIKLIESEKHEEGNEQYILLGGDVDEYQNEENKTPSPDSLMVRGLDKIYDGQLLCFWVVADGTHVFLIDGKQKKLKLDYFSWLKVRKNLNDYISLDLQLKVTSLPGASMETVVILNEPAD